MINRKQILDQQHDNNNKTEFMVIAKKIVSIERCNDADVFWKLQLSSIVFLDSFLFIVKIDICLMNLVRNQNFLSLTFKMLKET